MARKLYRHLFQSTGFTAILLITLVLAVQYAGAWYGLEILRISKESELENHLKDLGRMAPAALLQDSLEFADAAYGIEDAFAPQAALDLAGADSPLAAEFRARVSLIPTAEFANFADAARLNSLTLLDDSGRILHSTSEPERVWGRFDFLDLDRPQFDEALAGRASGSLAYRSRDSSLKRVYLPVNDPETGSPAAVLCMTAGRDYLAELDTVGDAMLALTAVSTVLILLIGWMVYRLIMRQRKYELRAAHADRLSSLGTLAAGFAHEVRNPLEIISACTEDLDRTLRDSHAAAEAQEACRDILEEVERLNRLVGQFLQYSKADAAGPAGGQTSVPECLSSVLAMLRHPAEKKKAGLTLVSELAPGTGITTISESSLRQILVNLMMNAIQAAPEGGRVEIHAGAAGSDVQIAVADTGPGIPVALRQRVFEPFFTTRPEGSGLGLAISHQLARSAGGSLEYQDRPGGGACFVLSLPKAGREGTAKSVELEAEAKGAGS